jgi:hypothetical protein
MQAFSLFALSLVFFDQGGAREKDRGKGQEEAARHRSVAVGDSSSGNGRETAQPKTDQIFVPSAFLQGAKFRVSNHLLSHEQLFEPERNNEP